MNAFSLLLLAAALVVADSTTVRGSSSSQLQVQDQLQGQDMLPNHRRRLLQESTCTLFRKCVTYEPTEEHPKGHHTESWVCELSKQDSRKMDVQFVDIVESSSIASSIVNATSGETTLTVSEAIIDTDSPRMFIPEDARVAVGIVSTVTTRTEVRQRRLTKTIGVLNTLVIRVSDKHNVQPDASIDRLKNDVFDDASSLKTQTEACSYGKVEIKPFQGNTPNNKYISNGIVDVKIDYSIGSGDDGMDQAALKAANEQLGDLNDPMFDLIMFCFPPGNNFLAFAYPNSKYSFYNNQWCGFVAAQMHEVGHNLGLAHSGQLGEDEYGDGTGIMGGSANTDDNRMCFNPQKNYQLGWYEDKVETINPLDGIGRREFVINGVSDYEKNDDALVVLRLKQMSKEQDYYIGFNRATGINRDTSEDKNMLTIVRKEYGLADQYGQSTKVSSLIPGKRHVIENFNGERDIQIVFLGLKDGDAKILVIDNTVPLSQPTKSCKKFTIELTTDDFPGDNSWYIADTGGWGEVAALSPVYTNSNSKYLKEVCLPLGPQPKTFEFTISDEYGDGMCCNQGNGSYKIYDSNNNVIYSGGQNFESEVHLLNVPKDPNPAAPTLAPTHAPTSKPTTAPPCLPYSIEIKTDRYPGDTSWKIFGFDSMQDEFVLSESPKYNDAEKLVETEVCLIEGRSYEFRIADSYGDGLCCGSGQGYYRVIDKCGKVVVDSSNESDGFDKKTHVIGKVENTCVAQPEQEQCEDRKGKFGINAKGRKSRCKRHAKRNKCDKKVHDGKHIWEYCPVSCGRCDDL